MTKLLVCGVCGRPYIDEDGGNCPFCGAHTSYIYESKNREPKKWRCELCGHEFNEKHDECPICNASSEHFLVVEESKDLFDLDLNEEDIAFAQKALDVEVSNSTFYFCAAEKSDQLSERFLFKALGEVEREHAVIWQKVLKMSELPIGNDDCEASSLSNLEESRRREDTAIKFYAEAADKSENKRLKMLFKALVEIETDHLDMSQERIENLSSK